MPFRLSRAYVEYIHDELVAKRMPFDEPIDPNAYRDCGVLDSAVNRPFHTFDGEYLHPTIFDKAAALFHSIACDHAFFNGNKRTAVMALDMFLIANGHLLLTNNADIYTLAKETAEANMSGIRPDDALRRISEQISVESMTFESLLSPEVLERVPRARRMHELCLAEQDAIRSHPLNSTDSN